MSKLNKLVTSQIEGSTSARHDTNTYSYTGNGVFVRHDDDKVGKLVVGPGVLYGANKDSADQSGFNTIKLIPNEELSTDQYLVVEPTSPNHIHIRPGGTQDDSNADLILGAERTKVQVSDGSRNVIISTKLTTLSETFTNVSGTGSAEFIAVAPQGGYQLSVGWKILIDNIEYTVASVTNDTPTAGYLTITIEGVNNIADGAYTFYYDPPYDNYWYFTSDGYISGPGMGSLLVSGIINASGDLYVQANDHDVIIGASNGGEYLGDSNSPGNQIATLSDVGIETVFSVNGGSLGTQPTFDGAPLFTGSYVKTGSMVHFQIQVDMDNITSFGTGQYYVDLPFDSKYNYQFKDGCLHDISNGNQFAIGAHVAAGTNRLFLTYIGTNGQDEIFDHNSPITLATVDNFHISGSYISTS